MASETKKYQQQYDQFMGVNADQRNVNAGNAKNYTQWGNTALQTWGDYTGAGIDPEAINRARTTGEKGIADYGSMVSGMYNNPGYSQVEQSNMRGAVTQPISAAFRTAQTQMTNQGAQMGNAGAAQANVAEMGRERARTISSGLSGLYGQFGDARRADQATAMQAQAAVPGMAGGQFQNEMANTSQLQFPVTQLAGQQQNAMGNQLTSSGQQLQGVDLQRQQANKQGFLKQLALAGASGASSALTQRALQ